MKPLELKAEPMDSGQLDRWLSGRIPRRILMLPFGGPVKAEVFGFRDNKARDIDGEYFDGGTDIYGQYPSLRQSRKRVVDFHHDQDPTGVMKGAIIGHLEFDEDPEKDGIWADFWANAGEKRRRLVATLERRGVPLFGSSQAVSGAVKKSSDGHIDVWPLIRHTITTSPQNTYAVVPALKAALDASTLDDLPAEAIKALLVGLDPDLQELLLGSQGMAVAAATPAGDGVVTLEHEQALGAALDALRKALLG